MAAAPFPSPINLTWRIGDEYPGTSMRCTRIDWHRLRPNGPYKVTSHFEVDYGGGVRQDRNEVEVLTLPPAMPEDPPPVPIDLVDHWTGKVTQLRRDVKASYTLYPRRDWVSPVMLAFAAAFILGAWWLAIFGH